MKWSLLYNDFKSTIKFCFLWWFCFVLGTSHCNIWVGTLATFPIECSISQSTLKCRFLCNQIFQFWNLFVGVIRFNLIGLFKLTCVSQAFTSKIVKAKLDTGILVNILSDYILALLILIVCTYRVSINVIH